MNPSHSAGNLAQAARDLANEWQHTKTFWRDSKSQEFEEKYIDVLPGHVQRAIAVLGELGVLLKKVRSDCE